MNLKTIRAGVGRVLAVAEVTAVVPSLAWGQASCNGLIDIEYSSGVNFAIPGDILTVKMEFGTGAIMPQPGQLKIHRVRFNLDCLNSGLTFPNCTNGGAF